MNREKYSVLTTVYAKENPDYLKQSIDSMLAQTVPPSQYVLVEDGPLPVQLQAVISQYAAQYAIFKIVKLAQNEGCGPASIAGMKSCDYDLVARIDSDDIALPNRCELELALFENEPDLAVVGSDMYEFEDDPNHVVRIKNMPTTPEQIYQFGKRRNPFNHSTVMMRKSIVNRYGGYVPLRRSLDLELFTKLLLNHCKCRNIPQPLVKFRTGNARVKRKKNWTNLKCDLSVYKRNYQQHYMGLADYVYVAFRQVVLFLLPTSIANGIYNKLYRRPLANTPKTEG